MIKPLRRLVLVDVGPVINALGAKLIETPDCYKRMNSMGRIVNVGSRCRTVTQSDIGKKCILGLIKAEGDRIGPKSAKSMGLKEHWHCLTSETRIISVLEE